MLAAMKYRGFTWPNNPRTFEVELRRTLHSYKLPFYGFKMQNLGVQNRVFRGEGEFVGPDAYDSFRRLAAEFSLSGSGWLEHPVWQPVKVYFAKLKLVQEPREEYVGYSFEFWECEDQSGYTQSSLESDRTKYIAAQKNDTLALIATRYAKQLSEITALNPQVKSPDSIAEGQIIRIS